jgi:hypothetical protein
LLPINMQNRADWLRFPRPLHDDLRNDLVAGHTRAYLDHSRHSDAVFPSGLAPAGESQAARRWSS